MQDRLRQGFVRRKMPSSFSVGNNLMFKCYEEVKGCQDPIKHFVNIDIELIEPYGSL